MLGELNPDQIEHVLRTEVIGRIGCYAEGRIYVVPITYVYDGHNVYGHSAEGQKVRMMRSNPNVCFEVDHMNNMANWQSVVAQGTYDELTDGVATAALQLLISRLQPLIASETSAPAHELDQHAADAAGRRAVVYRIQLAERSGRFEKR